MSYSSKQTFDITGETKQRLQYWILNDLLHPVDKGRGVGTSRRYSRGNLLEIMLIQALALILKKVDFIRRILNAIRETKPSYFALPDDCEYRLDDECILSVFFRSQDDIMVFVHDRAEANECIEMYRPDGFIAVSMDLNTLKKELMEKINTL